LRENAEGKTIKKEKAMPTIQEYKIYYVKEPEHASTKQRRTITHRKDVSDFCKNFLSDIPFEKTIIIALNAGNKVIGFTSFDGTDNQCAVYPKNVFLFLLTAGASSFILAHNHPGDSENASDSDWDITEKLFLAGKQLDLPLLDHVIVAGSKTISLRDFSRWPR
jgi:DNA repair protein RadC